jgi:hypothetical protein
VNRLAQEAVLAGLARRLNEHGSWSGETHVQKVAYVLHELADVPFVFSFILYKHGPFSFQLRDELASMRADGLLERQPQEAPYGPRIIVTDRGRRLEERFGQTMKRYGRKLDWISERLGQKNVHELERLATALWVTRREPKAGAKPRAKKLTAIKPHVSREEALASVREIDELIQQADRISA